MAAVKKKRGNPNWAKGVSGNPAGRKPDGPDKRRGINKELLDATSEIAKKVIEQAKEGDLQAANLIFARVLPTMAPQTEKVKFKLDVSAPLSKQVEQVLSAMADGILSADVARQIIEAIGALGTIRQLDEFETRLKQLESVA